MIPRYSLFRAGAVWLASEYQMPLKSCEVVEVVISLKFESDEVVQAGQDVTERQDEVAE